MGKNWAIAIGINHYRNMRPLRYAQADAEAVGAFFRDELNFDRVDLFVQGAVPVCYEDGSPLQADPTFGNLDTFLYARFEREFLKPGDNLWFFFAGHGKRFQGRDYLMPLDGNPNRVERTAIPISDIAERLRRSGADNVILMIDACRGEDDRDGGAGIGQEQQKGIITLFSCSPNELSYEIEELQQGSFTHALLAGMRIQGAGSCATVERLDQHLKAQVPSLNRQYQKPPQTPYTRIEPASKAHLILLPAKATLQDVMAMKNDALEAEAEHDWDGAEHLWTRVLVASVADSQAIKGLQRIALRRVSSPLQPPVSSAQSIATSTSRDAGEPPVTVSPQETQNEQSLDLEQPSSSLRVSFAVVRVNATGEVIETLEKQAEQSLLMLPGEIELPLVKIPAGEFWMGAKDGEEGLHESQVPRHWVTVQSFWMGQYPVTQRQWKAIALLDKVKIDLTPDCSYFQGDDLPVEQVNWYEAVEFCDRLSRLTGKEYRLPTEAQWEYACRAGTETPFYFGETITTELANYRGQDWDYQGTTYPGNYGQGPYGEFRGKTTSVDRFNHANAFGLYDMHGNVFEWCQDHWHRDYADAPKDSRAWLTSDENTFRVLRGGSWDFYPRPCRSACRLYYNPDYRFSFIGFRVSCASPRALS